MFKQLTIAMVCATVLVAAAFHRKQERVRTKPSQSPLTVRPSVSVMAGRYLHGRKAVGGSLVPYGQVWRTGADEATKLTTDADLTIGTLKVPKGSYALFTVPGKDALVPGGQQNGQSVGRIQVRRIAGPWAH